MIVRATIAVLFLLVAAGAAARADSIIYIHAPDATLWAARPDGSHARKLSSVQLEWPSESNNGTIVAVGPGRQAADGTRGYDVWVFTRSGRLDHRISTPADFSTLDCPTFAPRHIHISPDGTKIAYDQWMCDHFTSYWTPTSSRGLNFPNQKLGQEGGVAPAWLGNDQLMFSMVSKATDFPEFARYHTGDGDNSLQGWFDDDADWAHGWYAFPSSDGRKVAVVEDDAADRLGTPSRVAIRLFSVSGGSVHADCAVDIPFGAGFANVSPSFSPDGRKLLFGEPDGIHIAQIGENNNCNAIAHAPLVIRDGTQGFWSRVSR